MASARLRWGILGTASIAIRRVIPALHASPRNEVNAIASRDPVRAGKVAAESGIACAFGSYDDLLADAAIDAVYIPLPNHLHVPWSVRALEAGKHVLCEKPIGLNAADAKVLLDAARTYPRLTVMEAFMYRCHPRWEMVRQLVSDGAIGKLGTVHTIFSYDNRNPADVRNNAAMGGGGWLDIGCYGVSVARFMFGAEPIAVRGTMEMDPVFGTDRLASAVLDFGVGTATVTCATQLAPHQSVSIHGSTGRIDLELPFNPPSDRPTTIVHASGGVTREITIESCNQYVMQVDRFAAAVLDGNAVPVRLEDSMGNMVALDGLTKSRSS